MEGKSNPKKGDSVKFTIPLGNKISFNPDTKHHIENDGMMIEISIIKVTPKDSCNAIEAVVLSIAPMEHKQIKE